MKAIFFFVLFLISTCGLPVESLAQVARKNNPTPQMLNAGKTVYTQYCLSCHQADGKGVPSLNPPLANTSYVLGNAQKLIQIILKGFEEDVEINGETYSNSMPPLNNLSDQQIADVLTYIRNSFGNRAAPIKASEVRQVRNKKG